MSAQHLILGFNVQGSLREAARACEQEVFLRAFGNTRDQLQEEYGPYDDQSTWITVSDEGGNVVGACRVIMAGPAGLKTLNDVAREPWGIDGVRSARAAGADLDTTWDIGTLGVREEHRGANFRVSAALYHGVLRGAQANQIQTLTAVFDEPARRVLAALDFQHVPLPGTFAAPYLGSALSTPVYYHASMLDSARRQNPDGYRLVIQGIGLDGVVVPDEASFVLPSREPVAEPGQPGRTQAA